MNEQNHKKIFSTPVFPIPPAFLEEELDFVNIARYVRYLDVKGAQVAITTVDTSGYNLLNFQEILHFNRILVESFSKTVVVGVPNYALKKSKQFVEEFESTIDKKDLDRIYYMWSFPEKYYNDEQVAEYFFELTDHCKRPCLFHAKPLKHSRHGYELDYEAKLINKISAHPRIVGMIEDSSHMAKASQIIKEIDTEDFSVIVAGGAMSKFEMQYSNGVTSFLTGVGSLFPEYALNYYDIKTDKETTGRANDSAARLFLAKESDYCETLMEMGWHLGFRTALQEMGFQEPYTRAPFPIASYEQRKNAKKMVEELASTLNLNI